jgi:hypothetical protein
MGHLTALETNVRIVVGLLVRGEYEAAARVAPGRIDADGLRRAVEQYGRKLMEPGRDWWRSVDIVPIDGSAGRAHHVVAPLWTVEEGRSDLTLELRSEEFGLGLVRAEIVDLHVP